MKLLLIVTSQHHPRELSKTVTKWEVVERVPQLNEEYEYEMGYEGFVTGVSTIKDTAKGGGQHYYKIRFAEIAPLLLNRLLETGGWNELV